VFGVKVWSSGGREYSAALMPKKIRQFNCLMEDR
jgi:hypothetical protein